MFVFDILVENSNLYLERAPISQISFLKKNHLASYRSAKEILECESFEERNRWSNLILNAEERLSKGKMPRFSFFALSQLQAREQLYAVFGQSQEYSEHLQHLQNISKQIEAWILDTNLSAVAQIEAVPTREHFLNEVDWKQKVYPGEMGDSADAEALFTEMAKLVPERRVPQLVPFADVDNMVWQLPYSPRKLFPNATESLLKMGENALLIKKADTDKGVDIVVLSAWRSAGQQATNAANNPNRNAVAGNRSAHRYGLAIDLRLSFEDLKVEEICATQCKEPMVNMLKMYRSPIYKWMFLYGAEFGWYPYRREPWHWEYNPPKFPEQFAKLTK